MSEFTLQNKLKIKNVRIVGQNSIDPNEKIFPQSFLDYMHSEVEKKQNELIEQFQEELKKEKNEAFTHGLEKGQEAAKEEYQKLLKSTFNLLNIIEKEIKDERDLIFHNEEQDIVSLIIKIARKVVDTEIKMDEQIVLNTVRNCLKLLSDREKIKVYVNPKDWVKVRENIHKLSLRVELPNDIDIISKEKISPGGCKVESETGSIDGDINTQFDEIQRRLLKDGAKV